MSGPPGDSFKSRSAYVVRLMAPATPALADSRRTRPARHGPLREGLPCVISGSGNRVRSTPRPSAGRIAPSARRSCRTARRRAAPRSVARGERTSRAGCGARWQPAARTGVRRRAGDPPARVHPCAARDSLREHRSGCSSPRSAWASHCRLSSPPSSPAPPVGPAWYSSVPPKYGLARATLTHTFRLEAGRTLPLDTSGARAAGN